MGTTFILAAREVLNGDHPISNRTWEYGLNLSFLRFLYGLANSSFQTIDSEQSAGKKDLLRSKKKDKKDKGYAALDAESSAEEIETMDSKLVLTPHDIVATVHSGN